MKLLRLPGTYRAQEDTWFLAEVLRSTGLARGRRVLDVCTGSGALAVAAARAGASSVTAVDLSARSVATAWANSRLNHAGVRVLRGDLFTPVADERFDLVVANPPYVPAAGDVLPRYRTARSWDAGTDGRALLDPICTGVADVLTDGGDVLVTHSVLCDDARTVQLLQDAGLEASVVARARIPFGPVMRSRAAMLEQRGLIRPGQRTEELVVVRGRVPVAGEASRTPTAVRRVPAGGQDQPAEHDQQEPAVHDLRRAS